MKAFTVLATGALLFFSQALAAPATAGSNASEGAGKPQTLSAAGSTGSPRCKSTALYNFCTADNAGAYCDATGFHCNFQGSCKGVCWCE